MTDPSTSRCRAASPSSPAAHAASAPASSSVLAERGAAVAFTFTRARRRRATWRSRIRDRGGRALALPCDVTTRRPSAASSRRSSPELGPVDILVNNAGIARDTHVLLLDAAAGTTVIDVNLRAAYTCVRAVVRGMLLRRWGRIINISSPSARMPLPGQTAYAASKAGLEGFTRGAVERPRGRRACSSTRSRPGLIDTDMLKTHGRRGAGIADRDGADAAGSAPLAKWPRWWRSWPPKPPATSPDRSSASTAACCNMERR